MVEAGRVGGASTFGNSCYFIEIYSILPSLFFLAVSNALEL
jgi:hypothetical protein